MLTSERDKRICAKYGEMNFAGFTQCRECPLRLTDYPYHNKCKKNSHYDRKTKKWVFDDGSEDEFENASPYAIVKREDSAKVMPVKVEVHRKYAKFLPDHINHGEWIQTDVLEPYYCSQCDKKPYPYHVDHSEDMYWKPKYCPNCGAYMDMGVEVEE